MGSQNAQKTPALGLLSLEFLLAFLSTSQCRLASYTYSPSGHTVWALAELVSEVPFSHCFLSEHPAPGSNSGCGEGWLCCIAVAPPASAPLTPFITSSSTPSQFWNHLLWLWKPEQAVPPFSLGLEGIQEVACDEVSLVFTKGLWCVRSSGAASWLLFGSMQMPGELRHASN